MSHKNEKIIEGYVIETLLRGEISHPVCIHRVKFTNGKFALIRSVGNVCFVAGASIRREKSYWSLHNTKIRLLPFEYISETESKRRFQEG